MSEIELNSHASALDSPREKDASEIQVDDSSADGDHVRGIQMIFVLVALMSAIFLTSLDFVSFYEKSLLGVLNKLTSNLWFIDNYCYRDSSHHRRIPQSSRRGLVWLGLFSSYCKLSNSMYVPLSLRVCSVLTRMAGGKAYGFFSLKIVFLIAILLFEIGSLVCGVAPSSVALIVGRAIAGLGAAGVNTGSFTLAAFCAPPKQRPVFTGLIGLSYGKPYIRHIER